jgi:hypothetical protein
LSTTPTPLAPLGPRLLTTMVYVRLAFCLTGSGASLSRTARLASASVVSNGAVASTVRMIRPIEISVASEGPARA